MVMSVLVKDAVCSLGPDLQQVFCKGSLDVYLLC